MALLLLAISGCSVKVPLNLPQCAKFHPIDALPPVVKTDITTFDYMEFKKDDGLPIRTAVCSFNNNNGDFSTKNSTLINFDDLFEMLKNGGKNYTTLKQIEQRSIKLHKADDE